MKPERRPAPRDIGSSSGIAASEERSIDPASAYVVKRFALKLAILLLFALAQVKAPLGFKIAAVTLAMLSALLSGGLAVYWNERPTDRALNYWDEAASFFGIAVLAHGLL
jgi:hypothetical protein